jgi:hypothetical protein
MFLRSEYFNSRKAARRLVDHFQLKLVLFGLEKLVTDITMDDLPDDALDCLHCGHIQILPVKDSSGRTIIFLAKKYQKYESCSLPEVRDLYHPLMQRSGAVLDEEVPLTKSSFLEFSRSAASYLVFHHASLGRHSKSAKGLCSLILQCGLRGRQAFPKIHPTWQTIHEFDTHPIRRHPLLL